MAADFPYILADHQTLPGSQHRTEGPPYDSPKLCMTQFAKVMTVVLHNIYISST